MTTDSVPEGSRLVLPKSKRPVGRPPKHGAYSGAELVPITKAKTAEIIAVLQGDKIMVGKPDMVIINLLSGNLAKIILLDRFFAACGIFDDEGKIRTNEMKVYYAALNSAARTCDQLGMTPTSRLKLGISMIQAKKDLAGMMSDEAASEEPA
ncbi:MAG: hypothetical protein M0R06_16825 [Sphaerochaeta sp.]|jgi:hypothetical protein|nr:hypothetical protein [Sphaerochaeta sp.]